MEYVLLGLVAAAIGYFFLKKRKDKTPVRKPTGSTSKGREFPNKVK